MCLKHASMQDLSKSSSRSNCAVDDQVSGYGGRLVVDDNLVVGEAHAYLKRGTHVSQSQKERTAVKHHRRKRTGGEIREIRQTMQDTGQSA